MVGDLLDPPDLRLMSVLMCGALATVPSQKHIAFITTALYACKDWMLHNPKFCEWLLQVHFDPTPLLHTAHVHLTPPLC